MFSLGDMSEIPWDRHCVMFTFVMDGDLATDSTAGDFSWCSMPAPVMCTCSSTDSRVRAVSWVTES